MCLLGIWPPLPSPPCPPPPPPPPQYSKPSYAYGQGWVQLCFICKTENSFHISSNESVKIINDLKCYKHQSTAHFPSRPLNELFFFFSDYSLYLKDVNEPDLYTKILVYHVATLINVPTILKLIRICFLKGYVI